MAWYGNSEHIIWLLRWNPTHAIDDRFKSFEIIIDSDDGDKLTSLISTITNQHPICIEIIPESDLFNGILTDVHMALLQGIPMVSIPKNCNITVIGLRYLLQSNSICISGCAGITGDELPLVSHCLKEVKCYGWGPPCRPSSDVIKID